MDYRKNNNTKVVTKLAVNSVKSSKMRNFFIIFTIALSVSLLMVMSLYTVGMETGLKRKVADMQHVIYNQVSEAQIDKLAKDGRVDVLVLYKSGNGMEKDRKMIQPVWSDSKAVKGDSSAIGRAKIMEGNLPEAMDEVAVSRGYCKWAGVEDKIGTKVPVSFLDGTTEEFRISGILDAPEVTDSYTITFSDAYAREGAQLKDVPGQAVVRIHGATEMSQSQFLEEVRDIATKSGIERKHINENNHYLDTLSGGSRQGAQTITIVILALGILFVSILVIYSVFYLSVIGRIRQFGQLRTIGMTKKQIRRMITKEGLLLSAIGIPIGVVIGWGIGYLLQKTGWDWTNTCLITIVVAIADILTVLVSIHKPAKIASTISPIEAAKYSGNAEKMSVLATKQLHRRLTPGNLAKMGAVRNRKKTILTMVSLGMGGILYMIATTYVTSTSLEGYSRQSEFRYGEFAIDLSYNIASTSEHGITDMQMDNPLNEELEAKIMAIDGVRKVIPFGRASIEWKAHGETDNDYITGVARGEITGELLEEGTSDYDEMVKNDEIYITANEVIEEIYGWKYELGDKVKLTVSNGKEEIKKEFTVAGFVKINYRFMNPVAGIYLMPEERLNQLVDNMNLNTTMVVSTEEEKQTQIEEQLNAILNENPLLTMNTLRELKTLDEAMFTQVFAMIIGLSIFIVGFSIINLVNTLINSIVTRKREFAMLQSIGMTNKQLSNMVRMEGLQLALGNLIITLIAGTAASYGCIKWMRYLNINYMHFTFPTIYFIGYVILVIGIPVLVSTVVLRSIRKQSLVDRLRVSD